MQKLLTFFISKNISIHAMFNDQSFNNKLLTISLVLNNWTQLIIVLAVFFFQFHLQQAKLRSEIRIQDGRGKK